MSIPRLSGLQVFVLRAFFEHGTLYISMDDAKRFDQRPMRSLWIQKWIEYKPKHGFRITAAGVSAWHDHNDREAWRKNPALPLFSLFDPSAYGIKAKVHTLPKRASAA